MTSPQRDFIPKHFVCVCVCVQCVHAMFEIKIPFVITVMSITLFYCHKYYVYVGPESLTLCCLLLVCVCLRVFEP